MDFTKPVKVYTAATNLDAHVIVEMLENAGVPAHVVEDQSGASLWAFGTISQFHKPIIWVDAVNQERATALIREYEEKQLARRRAESDAADIQVVCEECGQSSKFPGSLNGTTQNCLHCHAYVDVGELSWEDDFGSAEE